MALLGLLLLLLLLLLQQLLRGLAWAGVQRWTATSTHVGAILANSCWKGKAVPGLHKPCTSFVWR